MDEFRLIERLLRLRGACVPGVRTGAGDDAAVLEPPPGNELVVTTDTQIEGIHFEWDWLSPADVGYRAAMACHSDLAAMGARPWVAFSSLAIPSSMPTSRVTAMQRGLHRALEKLGAALGGGNVASAPDAFSITLAALGLAPPGETVERVGARPGDSIWCSGWPGRAALGRHELAAGRRRTVGAQAFRHPTARIRLGRVLAARSLVSAMIDISDGLAGDLTHLLGPSLGATLDRDSLLADPTFEARCRRVGQDPEQLVLSGGEDYELLFTVACATKASRIRAAGRAAEVGLRRVGVVEPTPGIRLVGGHAPSRVVRPRGFRHDVGRATKSPGPRRGPRTPGSS